MNHTNKYTARDAELLIQQLRIGRIPSFMGSFDSLLARNMVTPNLGEFHRGITQGQKEGMAEGFNTGLEEGLKEFIINGENQLFIDKTNGKIYPFSNNDQLLNSDKIGPIVKDFTVNEVYKKKIKKYTTFVDDYYQANLNTTNMPYNGVIDFSDDSIPEKINFDMKIASVEEDLNKRKEGILNMYKPIQSKKKRNNYELNDIFYENSTQIGSLTSKINKNRNNTLHMKKFKNELTVRNEIENLMQTLTEDMYSLEDGKSLTIEMNNLKNNKTKVASAFTDIKDRSTAMILTDYFNIVNVDQTRKIFPRKQAGEQIVDIFEKIKTNKQIAEESNSVIDTITNLRTNNKEQITLANLHQQLLIPQQKVKLNPDLYVHVKSSTNHAPLEIEAVMKKSTYDFNMSQKSKQKK
jgi:hypothetical protein